MNAIDQYVNAVHHNLTVRSEDHQRIEADLRAHLEDAIQAGDPLQAVLDRMGSPEEVASAFMVQVELNYASFGRRLVAFILDIAFLLLTLLFSGVIILALNNLIPAHPESP